jgi:hypothetical protein
MSTMLNQIVKYLEISSIDILCTFYIHLAIHHFAELTISKCYTPLE